MRRILVVLLIAPLLLPLAGCGSTATTEESPDGWYALSPEQADRIILDAILDLWPDQKPEKLAPGRIGYMFRIWRRADHDRIFAEAIPRDDDRVAFRVSNTGSAPAAGNPARKKLFRLITRRARAAERYQR